MATAYARHQTGSSYQHRTSSTHSMRPEGPVIIRDNSSGKRYAKGRFLGKGGFAKCYELKDMDTGEILAGKIVAKSTLTKHRAKEKLSTEIKIHRSLGNRHVVQFRRFFEDSENVYILLELCSSKSMMELHKARKVLTEPETRFYMRQLIDGTIYMHTNKVIHRDLKLGNLFLNGSLEVKIGDFGLATTIAYDGERKKTLCGTPNYIAPEILDGKEGHSYEVDVWSIGCILYTLLIGKPPFETNNIKTTYRKIKSNDYRIPSSANISEDARSLIRDMLHRDPTRRPSLQTIRSHPFLTQGFCPATLPLSSLTVAPTFSSARESKTAKDLAPRHALRTVNGNQGRAGFHSARTDTGAARKPSVSAPRRAEREPGYRSSAMNPPSSSTTTHAVASDELGRIHRQLTSVTTRQATVKGTVAPRPVPTAKASQGLWICKWVDYSNKYGLGYQLSDNSVGVLFNDATKIILAPDQQHIESVERESHGGKVTLMTLSDFPVSLDKKITLLKYFRNYMTEHLLNGADSHEAAGESGYKSGSLSFVKKWLRTKHAIVFRLSSGIIQINFFDHTKLIVNSPMEMVTFINKERQSNSFYMEDLAKSRHASIEELVSRLSYATDVVEHLMKSDSKV